MSLHWSEDEYRAYQERTGKAKPTEGKKREKKPKYNNRYVWVDGIRFHSQLEANRYCDLQLLKRAGEINSFGRQPRFIIFDGPELIHYTPDFIVWDKAGACWVEDTKGYEPQEFGRIKKMWASAYPMLPLKVIK